MTKSHGLLACSCLVLAVLAAPGPAAGEHVRHLVIEGCPKHAPGKEFTLTIVHFNDFHARYHPREYGDTKASPLALIKGFYQRVKAENPCTLFVSAGDEIEKGCVADTVSRGKSTMEIYKRLGLDLRVLGNHDFAYSLSRTIEFATLEGSTVLCSNHDNPEGPWAEKFVTIDAGGVKVGAFGLTTMPWLDDNRQHPVPFYPELEADYDYAGISRKFISEHGTKVDVMLLLSHLGYEPDLELAAAVKGLDVIVGGHSHTVLERAVKAGSGTIVVQAGAYGRYVGRLDLRVAAGHRGIEGYSYRLVPVTPKNMDPDPKIEKVVSDVLKKYSPDYNRPLCKLSMVLDKQDTALLASRASLDLLGADAAIYDPATVKYPLKKGGKSMQDMLDAFVVKLERAGTTGSNSTYVIPVSGEVLNSISEQARNKGLVFAPLKRFEPKASYTLAIQKWLLHRSSEIVGVALDPAKAVFKSETWRLLVNLCKRAGNSGKDLGRYANH